jgi:hypothetical protein
VTATDVTTTTQPAVVTVALQGYTLQYGIFSMQDGTVLALPEYVYTGTPDGQSFTEAFRVIPIDPQYIDLKSIAVRPYGMN